MSHVRLMCYQDNIGSKKIIEANGGRITYSGPCALAGGDIDSFQIDL